MIAPDWVQQYIGLPYRDRGRTRAGLDCFGLVRLVLAEQADIELPEYSMAPMDAADRARTFADEACSGVWQPVRVDGARCFDVARCKVMHRDGAAVRPVLSHVGIYVAPGLVLHIEDGTRSVIVRADRGERFARRIADVWRHRGLSDAA